MCRISEASIPEYAIFPVNAFVKLSLEDRAYCKASMASMSDCKNVKKIAAILSM